jgi:hypothetical protein
VDHKTGTALKIPRKIVISKQAFDKIEEMLRRPPNPTPALLELMQEPSVLEEGTHKKNSEPKGEQMNGEA